jgi:predicted RND superfamily exporter protein
MPVPPSSPPDNHAAIGILITIATYFVVSHWRTALRVILVVVIALAVYGAVAGLHGAPPLMASHHR